MPNSLIQKFPEITSKGKLNPILDKEYRYWRQTAEIFKP